MKFSSALVALVAAGLANAQLPNVPTCSLNCFVSALTTDGCSSLTDFACHCQKPGLVSTVTPCVKKNCDVADQISVSNAVESQCSEAGHPISVPPVVTTSETSASATPTETSASATPTDTTSSSSSASETPSSSASAPPTGSSTPTGGSGSSTPAGTSTPLPSKTSGGASSSTSPAYNAAGSVKGNMAGVAAVAAAAAYIL